MSLRSGLNRNILECKWRAARGEYETVGSLNRNILECKYAAVFVLIVDSNKVLIETYWNVNKVKRGLTYCLWRVLIETYWNVNLDVWKTCQSGFYVLIETYWNVNISLFNRFNISQRCLNRNILECKFI